MRSSKLVRRKASRHSIRTVRSADLSRSCPRAWRAATENATGTTVSNLNRSAISYTKLSGFPRCRNPMAGAYPAARTAASVNPYRQDVADDRQRLMISASLHADGSYRRPSHETPCTWASRRYISRTRAPSIPRNCSGDRLVGASSPNRMAYIRRITLRRAVSSRAALAWYSNRSARAPPGWPAAYKRTPASPTQTSRHPTRAASCTAA